MEPITRNSTLLYEGLSRNIITSPPVTVPCFRDERKQANKGDQHMKPGTVTGNRTFGLSFQSYGIANHSYISPKFTHISKKGMKVKVLLPTLYLFI